MSDLAKRIAALSPEKRELLLRRLGERRGDSSQIPISPQSRDLPLPLSFAQQRLWFLDQLEQKTPLYNISRAFVLSGALNVRALEASLNEVGRRHETLRTTFVSEDGQPRQIIAPSQVLELPVISLETLPLTEREAQALGLATQGARYLFDLRQGPLLRATLLRLDARTHIFLLTLHHIVADGWSLGILFRELSELYAALSAGQRSPLPDLPVQYADYALWQRSWLQGDVLEARLAYWRKQLAGAPNTLELPTDHPRPAVQTFQGAHHPFLLPQRLVEHLKALSRKENVTLFITLLAAFQILLYRYSGQEDIVVGSPIANRGGIEIEGLIGFFANTLVLRTHLAGNPTVHELLSRVCEVTLDAASYQDLPFEKLVESLQPERSLSRSPLFQVLFQFQQDPKAELELAGLKTQLLEVESGAAKFDLVLEMAETPEGVRGDWEYSTDLFEQASIEQMARHYQVLLESMVVNPEQRIDELPLLTAAEQRQQVVEWNATQRPYPQNACIHELFEAQVQRTPDAVAVVWQGQGVTYQELNKRANQLGHYLRRLGVRPDGRVGVCMRRSLELVVGVLAILKAGGAYVPLDPTYPEERLSLMLEDAQVQILLTQEGLAAQLRGQGTQLLCLDALGETLEQQPGSNLVNDVRPENLAYVIYTSGSTGKPKGIAMWHRPLVNMITWQGQSSALPQGARTLQFASLSFDVSFQEMFSTWCSGGTLVLISEEVRGDPEALLCCLSENNVERLFLPFVALHQLAEAAEGEEAIPTSLHQIITAGEQLQITRAIARLLSRMDGCVLQNQYGPSETHAATAFDLVGLAADWPVLPPIGRPLANMQIYLLDSLLRLVPAGVPGEISIGGAGLARGYLNRPELTAERFIPHPFSTEPGARLYKTGDLARYLPDGTLEFLGRNDDQVKIRGYRIELGEIEAALAQHPAVRKSAVIAYDDPSGGKRLAAYIVLSQHQAMLSMRELRSYLQAKLPEYMIPSVFVPLETLPLTPSGKINRRALPTPDLTLWPTQQKAYRAPRTPIEEVLASIWAAVLGLDQVGMDDNFFELGGHSLLATQLVARVREAFQIALPLRSLFEMPTVATLAASIAERKGKSARSLDERIHLPTIRPNPSQRYVPFPLTDVQQAYWVGQSGFFELGGVATHGYLELESVDLDLERFSRAWQRLIDRHDMLRAIVHPDGQQQVLEQLPPYPIALLDLRGQDTEMMSTHLAEVRQQMSHQLFRTDQWPLFELRASRLDDHRTRLHISFHALIADAWSWQILGRELSECYQNPDVSLAPLELSFRDYVMAELALRSSEDYQRSQNYWWERLSTLPPAPELPLMESPSSLTHHRFVPRSATLGTQTWQQLKQRAIRVGATPSGVLLAAFAEILATWSKSPHFTLNLTLFNRLPLHPQVNDIVGDFTSLTLLEVKHSAQETFAARVRRLQEQLWDDLDHRYVNGVQVQRELARKQGGPPRATMPVVFSSALTLEKQGAQQGSPWSWLGTRVYSITQTPQVWLDHQVYEQAGALVFNWDAVEELFPPGLLDEMFDAYCQLLHRLAHEEERWQEQTFQLVPRAQLEQRALVNATEAPLPAGLLQTGFAAQVPQRAQQPAVIAAERTLTYEELARRSNQVGHQLRHLGVEPNTLVAVVMEKGWEQIVGVLGILQAGAAYLPIDAGLPRERLWYLLKHGEVRVALTQSHLNETLEWPEPLLRLCLDSNELEDVDDQPLEPVQRPEDLAYVIYTSGSTGLPKGVMINHQGAVNTIVDINHRFGVGPQDRVLALSSLSFDLSVYDIFGTLAAGGTIVIPAAAAMRDPAHWTALMVRERITLWNSVPALMEMLVDYLANRSLKLPGALRLVLLSGDWIPVTLPGQIKSLAGGVEVVSLGGATEASIWSILYPIETVDPTWKSIPYGRPMVNQRFHVFNESLEPSPVWVPGQLYIGGIGLARGYWRDEAKTTASFFIHPKTGERLYRTGDLGRYLPDGSIEFLGREDFQVKIQGYRIELGEIEAALLQNPAVRATVVTVAAEPPRNKRLVAYVVPQQDATPSSSELRQFLHERLPDYMVPASFVLLDTLPLTPNGKVDRMALPAIAQAPSAPAQAVKAARTPIITRIAQVAASVLHSDELDPEINLLDFGANSVDMIRIVNRLELVLGFRPKLDEFFRFPTIVALARSYEEYLLQTHANPVQDDLESALNRENVASLEKPLNLEDREEGEL